MGLYLEGLGRADWEQSPLINPQPPPSRKKTEFPTMKNPPNSRTLRFMIAAACWGLIATAAPAQLADIGVRSKVIDKDLQWSHQTESPDSGGHSKTYGILAVDEIKSGEQLVKPVNEQELLRLLFLQLEKNGFHKYAKGTKPDILLTLSYGRGEMTNPFLDNVSMGMRLPARGDAGTPGADNPVGVVIMRGAFSQQLVDQKTPGFEANLQKADFEKLFLRVTAWDYPKGPKVKPKMLWKTIIVADDPDHRDLNAIAAQMLEAGAPYFDKDIKGDKREINIYKPVPDGRVNVGAPEVVQTSTPTTK